MELTEAIKILQGIWRNTKFEDSRKRIAIETVLTYVRDSISKDDIRKVIVDLEKVEKYEVERNVAHYAKICMQGLLGEE